MLGVAGLVLGGALGCPSLSHWGKLARKTLPPTFHFVATQRRPAGRQQGIRVRTSHTCACPSLIFWFPSFILVPMNNAGRYVSPRYLDRTRREKKRACRKQLCLLYTPCPVPKIACVQVGAVSDGSLAGLCNSGTRYHFYVRTEKIGTGVRVRMYSAHCVAVPISSVDCVYCSRWVLQDAVLGTKKHSLHALLPSSGCQTN